jgi:hypothetical protein
MEAGSLGALGIGGDESEELTGNGLQIGGDGCGVGADARAGKEGDQEAKEERVEWVLVTELWKVVVVSKCEELRDGGMELERAIEICFAPSSVLCADPLHVSLREPRRKECQYGDYGGITSEGDGRGC